MSEPRLKRLRRAKFQGRTKAYGQFRDLMWRTRSLISLGTIGIDQELEKRINPLLAHFAGIKGRRGRRPKDYKPHTEVKKLDDDKVTLSLDERSAFTLRQALESSRKRHDELRYFLYANLAVAIWAAFETYSAALFEQLYRERPELLKSSEHLSVKDAVDNRETILDFLIERQLENIGHLDLPSVLAYYRNRLGIEVSSIRCKRLEAYYFLRNVVAHKTGLLRPAQRVKASADFHMVGDEIRVSRTFLVRMATFLESTVRFLELQVMRKFYKNTSPLVVKPTV